MRREQHGRSKLRLTRRQAITTAATVGVGAAAISVTGLSLANESYAGGEQQIVVHLRDPKAGILDVFVGESRVEVKDKKLADSLRRAAAGK
ncbi:hypothetical protein [Micromonospora zhanjiangensis]|uniref:Tat (Twin-arginine translocation) pathway signal sequence n=1 Tax=Micromonospora zhanjiangensis TaxID=1522057 RepID=A0ABV8KNA2_9ACTN